MSDLDDLYQEVILDHQRNPRNFARLPSANRQAEGTNPLCGDHVTVYLDVKDGVIRNISFEGEGCAIAKASASMMTSAIKGKTVAEASEIFKRFHRMVMGDRDPCIDIESLGKLAAFSGVSAFPVRVKCASLAWHTLSAAMNDSKTPVVIDGDASTKKP
jgi:nitrogen fixation protein NifU and related proteins